MTGSFNAKEWLISLKFNQKVTPNNGGLIWIPLGAVET
jgi:hypothetical protein